VLFNKYTFSNVNANHSLQVVFGINSYNISASATTGGSLSPVGNATVNYGGGVTYNFTPNTGYHVKAVTVNGNNISPSESYSFFEVHEDQTLFVEFEINTYTVNFDAQGGSTVINKAAVHNTGITPPTVPTRTGYTFGGWYKESSYTNLWNFNTDKVIANTTLYANWLINTYTVSFNTQDGSALSTHEVDYNSTVMPFIPKRTGYTFGGWYRESACINRWSITDKVTSSITLYAKWIVNTYTVNFDSQGGSRVISKIADYNTPILAPGAPTKTGYKFAGWFKESTLTNAWNFSADKVNANTTLYAKWDANIYTVNFNSQGGSTVSSKTVNYNYTIAAPSAPTFTGYLFEGWFKESTCINAWNFSSDKVTSNIILYAKWSPKTYSVEFISNGIIVKSTMVEYNSLITEPIIPQQIGHKLSWSSSNNNLPFLEWDFSADRVTSNIKLYAIFTPLSYTVTFNSQGGSAVNSKLAVYNSTITVPVEPIREGFIFEGWYKDIRCTSIWNFRTDIVKTNTTLYAKWKVNTYTITATKTGSGTMTPSGNLTVSYGGNLTYTFAASTGYYIKNVVVNGVSKGALSSYTFSNVTANQYISVEFEVNGFISLSTLALRFSNSGEVKTFTISSNINWSISSNETWISVSPSSGSGNKTINVNCSFYRPSRFESYRTGTITISGGGITKTIHIHQGELLEL